VSVLLIGEHGSGKELLARTIHESSARAGGPFVSFDCSSVEANLHEQKLFGADAADQRISRGIFDQASGGVLYLEHIEKLSLEAQAALASAMSGRASRRDAASVLVPNVRVIAGSTTSLRAESDTGKFREELFFRLVVFPLELPPLRLRREDIPHMVGHLIREHGSRFGGDVPDQISPEALETLAAYDWPGNLRQLENVVQRGLIAASGKSIHLADLPPEVRGAAPATPLASLADFNSVEIVPLRELERRAIEHALRVTHGSVSLAAKRLGIGRATLYRRIASLDLSLDVA
jgi:DNA-binding NtrC family response regulator